MDNLVQSYVRSKINSTLPVNGGGSIVLNNYPLSAVSRKIPQETLIDEEKRRKRTKYFIISGVSVLIGLAVAGFSHKGIGGIYKKANTFISELSQKIQELAGNKNKTAFQEIQQKTYTYLKNTISSVVNVSSNVSAGKDLLATKGLEKIPFMDRVTTKITKWFKKMAVSATEAKYKKAQKEFEKVKKYADKLVKSIEVKGLTEESKEKIQLVKETVQNMEKGLNSLSEGFSAKRTDTIDQYVETIAEAYKTRYAKQLNDIKDKSKDGLKQGFDELAVKLKEEGEKFQPDALARDSQRKLLAELLQQRKPVSEGQKTLLKLVEGLENEIGDNVDDKLLLKMGLDDFKKSLNKAVRFESDNLLLRLRDLALGAAPVEFLSLFTPLPFLAGAMHKAENNEEKTETAIKAGVPILGGMLGWAYATSKVYNGVQSIAFGLGSSLAFSVLGTIIDHWYVKNHADKQKAVTYNS
jgi:hypothetical protein